MPPNGKGLPLPIHYPFFSPLAAVDYTIDANPAFPRRRASETRGLMASDYPDGRPGATKS